MTRRVHDSTATFDMKWLDILRSRMTLSLQTSWRMSPGWIRWTKLRIIRQPYVCRVISRPTWLWRSILLRNLSVWVLLNFHPIVLEHSIIRQACTQLCHYWSQGLHMAKRTFNATMSFPSFRRANNPARRTTTCSSGTSFYIPKVNISVETVTPWR